MNKILLIGLFGCASAAWSQSPAFNCGSNGSYGAMNITANTTLALPADGIFHCTTVSISPGATLRFNRNVLNTPVYILATGNVDISGVIDVSGLSAVGGRGAGALGGPGGFDGGAGTALNGVAAGYGRGPGGGRGAPPNFSSAGGGSYKTAGANNSTIFGNSLLIPLVGGSGGGGMSSSTGGGGGGGAILIASNTVLKFILAPGSPNGRGSIIASGGTGSFSIGNGNFDGAGGSGGAIRLVAPTVTGAAYFNVFGGGSISGGLGRVRVDTYDSSSFTASGGPDAMSNLMMIFPTPVPKLSVANAAGTAVAENTSSPVSVILPAGSNPSQSIQVRARDFGSVVPVRVRVIPDSGEANTYDGTIDNTVNNPATASIPVTLPVNTAVRVEVYTR